MQIAFYAPIKPPDDPVPSGDRQMARQLMAALKLAGHDVLLASDLRTFARAPSGDRLVELGRAADREIERLSARISALPQASRPDAWLTYHPYYKSPDLIGPEICKRFAIAYFTAEASYAAKHEIDNWRTWQSVSRKALQLASAHFCMTGRDREGIAALLGGQEKLVDLPPFIDTDPFVSGGPEHLPEIDPAAPVRLITVAMMREGVKLMSYQALAKALSGLTGLNWILTVVGGGPAQDQVWAAFGAFPEGRVRFAGALQDNQVREALFDADLFLWPGIGEAYGVAYLEAQAAGLPVVAFRSGGVESVVRDQETGLLIEEHDVDAYAKAVSLLITDCKLRRTMGHAAHDFVLGERDLAHAAAVLDRVITHHVRRFPLPHAD